MKGFTLIETLLALGMFALLAGGIYAVSSAAVDASSASMENQSEQERLDSFLRATRNAFLNIPRKATVELRYDTSGSAGTPEIVFQGGGSYFGIPTLAGGELILSARPQSDGTRTFSLLRIPRNTSTTELSRVRQSGGWLPLFPYVEKVRWEFFDGREWQPEWSIDTRPRMVRLSFLQRADPENPIESIFYVPHLQIPTAQQEEAEEQSQRESQGSNEQQGGNNNRRVTQ